jgi:DNA-binding CsgD family transcriptional regulator/PAS domain-containing protein
MHRSLSKTSALSESMKRTWLREMDTIFKPRHLDEKELRKRVHRHVGRCAKELTHLPGKSVFILVSNPDLQYIYVSDSVKGLLGYTKEEIITNGFQWLFSLLSPEELDYKQQLMRDVYEHFEGLNRDQILNAVVRYDIVVKRSDGELVHLLEEMMLLEVDDAGKPLITSCFLHNINSYGVSGKRQCRIYLTRSNTEELSFSKNYCIHPKAIFRISSRELEVLEQFANGLSTEQVANKLFVSANTIKTHRKNILFKMGVQNTSEAIKIAFQHQWLS